MTRSTPALMAALSLRSLLGALALSMALVSAGCTATPQKPPTSPLKQAVKDELTPEQKQDLQRKHVAPPPAYGNKVVLAEQDEASRPIVAF